MFLIDDLFLMPARGIMAVFREVHNAAQQDAASEAESIRNELSELYMRLETQQLSEADFDAREKVLLDRLDELERRKSAEAGDGEEDEDDDEDDDEDYDEDYDEEADEEYDEDFDESYDEDEDEDDADEGEEEEDDADADDEDFDAGQDSERLEDGGSDDLLDRAALGNRADVQAAVRPVVEPDALSG